MIAGRAEIGLRKCVGRQPDTPGRRPVPGRSRADWRPWRWFFAPGGGRDFVAGPMTLSLGTADCAVPISRIAALLLDPLSVSLSGRRPGQRQSIPRWCCRGFRPVSRSCRSNQSGQAGSGGLRTRCWWCCNLRSLSRWPSPTLVVFTQIDFARQPGSWVFVMDKYPCHRVPAV